MNFVVIGDSCVDEYYYCDSTRLCPESPVPLLDIKRKTSTRGMAGNVFNNFKKLCDTVELVTNENWELIKKSRYVDGKTNHMFIRVDTTDRGKRINLDEYEEQIIKADAIVISDYNKGFLSESDITQISLLNKTTFLDTKKVLGDWASSIKFIKINRGEYNNSRDKIIKSNLCDKIIKTIGGGGAVYQNKQYKVKRVDIKDLSGAGDTFIAGLAFKYIQTNDIEKAIEYANECATIVVSKKGTSTL